MREEATGTCPNCNAEFVVKLSWENEGRRFSVLHCPACETLGPLRTKVKNESRIKITNIVRHASIRSYSPYWQIFQEALLELVAAAALRGDGASVDRLGKVLHTTPGRLKNNVH